MKLIYSSASLIALVIAAPAFAQTGSPPSAATASPPAAAAAGATVGDVIVTAQRRAENLQNVPIAVEAVSRRQLTVSGVTNVQELGILVPGVQLSVSAGNANNYIRGVGSQVTGPGLESPIALYVDGVYYSSTFGAPANLSDVGQVEVLKGPQGTLFGRNATGGLIQITTRSPTQTPTLDADFSYGNYDTSKVDFYGSTGVAPNLAANLAVVASHQGEGYGVNFYNGEAVDKTDLDLDLRSKWVYTPTEGTTLTAIFDYDKIDSSINSLRILPGSSLPAFLGPTYGGSRYDTDNNVQPVLDHQGGGASLRLDQDLGFARLVDTVAYRQGATLVDLDIDTTATNFSAAHPALQNEGEFTEELQLQSEKSSPVTWTGGVFYYHDNASLEEHVLFGPIVKPPFTGEQVDGSQISKSVAGYGQATVEILPATHLTVGGRYTYEERTLDSDESALIGPVAVPLLANYTASKSYERATYRVALDHRFSPNVLAYISVDTGFKSGGFNSLAPTQPAFGPETLTAYAVGLKTDLLDNRLRINMEGFYYDYENLQLGAVLTTSPGVTSPGVINGGTAHDYGFDVDAVAQVTDAFRITAGLELLNSHFSSTSDNIPIGSLSGAIPTHLGSVTGNTVPFSPAAVVNLAGDYELPIAGGMTDFNLTYQYNTGYYPEPDNIIRQPAFSLLNAAARWTSPNGRYLFSLWGKNLTDAAVMQNELTVAFGPHGASYLAPRTFGFTVGVHY